MRALKLNLGCGHDKRDGYVNIDVDPRLKPDVVHDLLQPLPFETDSATEVLLQDVLEHVTREQALELLKECARVLKKNGKLLIRVPNVLAILRKYHDQPDLLMLFLYGDTTVSGTWGAHKYGYTPKLIQEMVKPFGLTVVSQNTADTNYEFELVKKKNTNQEIVCQNLSEFIWKTLVGKVQQKQITWRISHPYNSITSKVLLRPLSRFVDAIELENDNLSTWVRKDLQFSHLRMKTVSL